MTSPTTSLKNGMYLATIAEKKINAYNGVMPLSEQNTLALNLGELLELAKDRGIRKGDIVVAAGVPHRAEAPVNALNSYCILPKMKSKRRSKARLCAHPQNYLRLALAAADLMQMMRHDAIVKLTEGSNAFSAQDEIDEEIFSPAQATWRLLKAKIAVLAERHELKQYFRDAYKVSAVFGENILRPDCWEQEIASGLSVSYWPSVYLGAVIRSSASACFNIKGSVTEVGGQVHAIEQVFLTLGWHPSGWIIGYLECLPGLAVQSLELERHTPLFDLHCSGETFTHGAIGNVSFTIDNGGSIKVPDGCQGDWPYRLRSRKRFEPLTPQQIATTLLDCQLIRTPNQTLSEDIDTTAVLSPPDSPLGLMEAQLLGRESTWPNRRIPCFLDKLEEDIVFLQTSFREWRRTQLESARKDHHEALTTAMEDLEDLRHANRQPHRGLEAHSQSDESC
jgi:hypothetical protein